MTILRDNTGRAIPECLHSGFYVELRMMVVALTLGAILHEKFQSNHHHQQTNTQLFTDRMPFLSPKQQCQTTEKRKFCPIRRIMLCNGIICNCFFLFSAKIHVKKDMSRAQMYRDARVVKLTYGMYFAKVSFRQTTFLMLLTTQWKLKLGHNTFITELMLLFTIVHATVKQLILYVTITTPNKSKKTGHSTLTHDYCFPFK